MIIYERLAEVPGVVRGILKNLTKKYFKKRFFFEKTTKYLKKRFLYFLPLC